MNNELMRDENFIRCSTMIAELLMKYKSKEMELGGESKEDSPPSFFAFRGLKIILSSRIIKKMKMITTDKIKEDFSILSAVMEGDATWKTATYILVFRRLFKSMAFLWMHRRKKYGRLPKCTGSISSANIQTKANRGKMPNTDPLSIR